MSRWIKCLMCFAWLCAFGCGGNGSKVKRFEGVDSLDDGLGADKVQFFNSGLVNAAEYAVSDTSKISTEYWPAGMLRRFSYLVRGNVVYESNYSKSGKFLSEKGVKSILLRAERIDSLTIELSFVFLPRYDRQRLIVITDMDEKKLQSVSRFELDSIYFKETIVFENDVPSSIQIGFITRDTTTGLSDRLRCVVNW